MYDGTLGVSERGRPLRARRIALAVLLSLAPTALLLLHGRSQPKAREPTPAVSVAVANVRQEDVPVVLPALGTVTPFATVTVRSQISGYLTSVAANEGRISHKGEFLQQIDARPYHASAEQIQGQLVRDQALRRTDAAAPLHVTALDSDSGERLAAGTLESIDNPPPPYDTTHRVTSCLSSPTPVQRTSARSPSASNGRIEP